MSIKHLSSTCHVSFLAALDTDNEHKFTLTHFIHSSYLSDGLTFTNKPYDSQPISTLRWSTAEWRINTNPISHRKQVQVQEHVGGSSKRRHRWRWESGDVKEEQLAWSMSTSIWPRSIRKFDTEFKDMEEAMVKVMEAQRLAEITIPPADNVVRRGQGCAE